MQLQIFNYESDEEKMLKQIRTVEIDGEIWFVAKDVATALGYQDTQKCGTKTLQKGTTCRGWAKRPPLS